MRLGEKGVHVVNITEQVCEHHVAGKRINRLDGERPFSRLLGPVVTSGAADDLLDDIFPDRTHVLRATQAHSSVCTVYAMQCVA